MRKLQSRFIGLTILLAAWTQLQSARAGSPTEWTGTSPSDFAAKVEALEKPNPSRIHAFKNAWETKCAEADDPSRCFLTEADLDQNGSKTRVLLFRGEETRYSLPASSVIAREALKGNFPCGEKTQVCSYSTLQETLSRLLSEVYPHVEFSTRGYTDISYLVSEGRWRARFCKKGPYDCLDNADVKDYSYEDLPAQGRLYDSYSTILYMLSTGHVDGYPPGMVTADGEQKFDPLVSFSANPEVAIAFASPGVNPGRLMVLSVDSGRLSLDNECKKNQLPLAMEFTNIAGCAGFEPHDDELEYDAFLGVNPADLKEVIVVPADNNLNQAQNGRKLLGKH